MTAPPPVENRPERKPAVADTPFGRGLQLGRCAGVPIRAHWSVLVIVVVLVALLATSDLPALRPGEATAVYWLLGVLGAVLFLASLIAHELAHAVVAMRFGMRVEAMTVWMVGGLTELDGEPPSPRADALIAAAGPFTSAVFAGAYALAAVALGTRSALGATFLWLAVMSAALVVFNLLPGAPLDGGRLLRAFLWYRTGDRVRAAERAATVGRFVGIWLAVLGALEVLAGDGAGLWLVLVAWFIISGARSESYAGRAERLGGLLVEDVMVRSPAVGAQWWTVTRLLASLDAGQAGQAVFPVVDIDGRAVGGVTIADLERVGRGHADEVRLADVLKRRPAVLIVSGKAPLSELILPMHLRGHVAVVIDDNARPVGVVAEEHLVRATRAVQLGWTPAR